MKSLFYNPFEVPCKIHIKSKSLGVDKIYEEPYYDCEFAGFDELFKMAKCECFDEVEVCLTEHEQAYYKPSKNSSERHNITGWVSLKGYANGGGYIGDKTTVSVKYLGEID